MQKSFKAFVFGGELAIYSFVSDITAIATNRNLLLIWTQAPSLWLFNHIEKSNVKFIPQSSLAHVDHIESMIQRIGHCRLLYWTSWLSLESKLCPPYICCPHVISPSPPFTNLNFPPTHEAFYRVYIINLKNPNPGFAQWCVYIHDCTDLHWGWVGGSRKLFYR